MKNFTLLSPVTTRSADDGVLFASKLPYQPPMLVALGDIRELTLGGSLGTGDSGSAGTQQF